MPVKGERLGPYELLIPLGAGGMGEVWKANDTRLRRLVAIKFSQAHFSERLEREARAVAALNHPNVAQIYDVGDNYIVMEYVDGTPVGSTDNVRKVLDTAVQMADGLAAAHRAGLIHRDLKPANVLLSRDGRVKILDFGLAKRAAQESGTETTETLNLTGAGFVVGTAAYMSPEQARGQALDFRTDQFSFGLILYEMLTGEPAFRRPSAAETMAAIIREDAEPLPPAVPAALRWIVERCLAKDPEHRYDSTRDLYRDLCQIRDHASQSSSSTQSAARNMVVTQGRVSMRVWAAVAAFLVLLLGGLATAWRLASRSVSPPEWTGARLGGPGIAMRPAVSPDGQLLAFSAMVNDQTQLAVMNPNSGSWTVLTHEPDAGMEAQASWAPDGSRIYYDRVFGGPQGVYEISPLGGQPRLVLEAAQCPHALRDGSLIVMKIDTSGHDRLYRYWPDSGKLQPLPALATGGMGQTPDPPVQVFPDGREVIYSGTPDDKPNTPAAWYVLDLASLKNRLLDAPIVPRSFAVGVSPDSQFGLLVNALGDVWEIAEVAPSGTVPNRPLISFPKPSNVYGISAGRDGSIYFDYMMRPSSVLEFDPRGNSVSETAVPIAAGALVPLGAGRLLIDSDEAGKIRLQVYQAGVGLENLLQTSEPNDEPVVRIGTDLIGFSLGAWGSRNIAIARLSNGQIVKRFRFDASAVRSLAATPDGTTLYFSDGAQVWSIATQADESAKPVAVTTGASVAIDAGGKYLYIVRTRSVPRPLVRIPIAGGPAETFAIPAKYTIADDPLSPASVDASGRIVFEIDSPDSWFERLALIDPSRKSFTVIPIRFTGDLWSPAWLSDGRIAAIGEGIDSSLWRYRPRRPVSK